MTFTVTNTTSIISTSECATDPTTKTTQRTPLNDISSATINKTTHTIRPSTSTIFPTSNVTVLNEIATIQSKKEKKKTVDTVAFGINLMNRFGYVNSNSPFETQGASSSATSTTQHIPYTVAEDSDDDSTRDEGNFQRILYDLNFTTRIPFFVYNLIFPL